jgi:capsular polysaccharide biosynthesis protein
VKPPSNVPRVRDYLRMLANGWLVIGCATVLSAAAVVGVQQVMTEPTYVASTQVFAVVPGDAGVEAAFEGGRGATVRIDTYSQLATSRLVTERTIDEVGLNTTPDALAERISVASIPGDISPYARPMSALMRIQVTGEDPDTTVDSANAVAKNLIAASQEVEWTESGPGAELVLVDSAASAAEQRPSIVKDLALGAAIGLVLSIAMVLAFGIARGTVLDRRQVDYVARQTVSGEVPWELR